MILGASSGFGAACARELAARGMNIAGVHLDRRAQRQAVADLTGELLEHGVEVRFFNANAAAAETRAAVTDFLRTATGGGKPPLGIVLHSLAFGALRPFTAASPAERVSREQLEMTLDVMASSLVYWVQDLLAAELLGGGTRIFAMTSLGSSRAWPGYGPVSAAKAALESNVRQLALELAAHGITVNALRAGVTMTPALAQIPGHERMIAVAEARNPSGRLTRPEDVARAVAALAAPETAWITGNVIAVDGGESIVA
ncbi:MAG: SDR family oxidoreductase [Candidatus Schekmanbacteria bacterium]|nr:SDR family oxidoreductase [Candidatus Schekmanbacteria bacterium]